MSNETIQLSEREREILRLVATGATNQQIAAQLNISANTVKVHLRNIFGKIGVASRTEASMYAVRNGLLDIAAIEAGNAPDLLAEDIANHPGLPIATPSDPAPNSALDTPIAPNASSAPRGTRNRLIIGGAFLLIALITVISIVIVRPMMLTPASVATPTELVIPAPEQRWRVLQPMPAARGGFAFVVFSYDGRQYLYAIGGEHEGVASNQVLRFDPQTNTWVQLSNKPTATADVQAVTVGDRVYIPGGRLESDAINTVFEAYEPRRDRWVTLAPLPAPRSGYALAAIEGKIYLFGGWDGTAYQSDVWQYNPDDDTWTKRTPLTAPRAFAGAVAVDNRVYVIGGENAEGAMTLNEVYAVADDESNGDPWATRSPLPAERSRLALATVGGLIFALGGGASGGTSYLYNISLDSWEALDLPLNPRLQDSRAQALNNKIYVAGGREGQNWSDQVFEYQAFYSVFLPLVPNN